MLLVCASVAESRDVKNSIMRYSSLWKENEAQTGQWMKTIFVQPGGNRIWNVQWHSCQHLTRVENHPSDFPSLVFHYHEHQVLSGIYCCFDILNSIEFCRSVWILIQFTMFIWIACSFTVMKVFRTGPEFRILAWKMSFQKLLTLVRCA